MTGFEKLRELGGDPRHEGPFKVNAPIGLSPTGEVESAKFAVDGVTNFRDASRNLASLSNT